MTPAQFRMRSKSVLAKARKLAESAKSWADWNNAVFADDGVIAKKFTTGLQRAAFFTTPEYAEVIALRHRLVSKFGLVEGATPKAK
jgi:hypothetical protein